MVFENRTTEIELKLPFGLWYLKTRPSLNPSFIQNTQHAYFPPFFLSTSLTGRNVQQWWKESWWAEKSNLSLLLSSFKSSFRQNDCFYFNSHPTFSFFFLSFCIFLCSLFIFLCFFIYISLFLNINISLFLSFFLCFFLPLFLSFFLCFFVSLFLCFCLSFFVSVFLSLFLSIRVTPCLFFLESKFIKFFELQPNFSLFDILVNAQF